MVKLLSDSEVAELQGDSGTFTNLAKGAFVGATKDPFIGDIIKGLGEIAGVDPRGLEIMERQLQGKSAGEIGEFIGEFAPGLLFGAGGFTLGKAAGVAGVRAFARQATAKGVQATSKGVSDAAARKGLLTNQFNLVLDKSKDIAGGLNAIQGTPGIQRAAEIAGANIGIGGVVFGQEKARGLTTVDALKSAGIAVLFGVGLEGGITLIGKSFGRARSFRINEIENRFHTPAPGQAKSAAEIITDEMKAGTSRVASLNHQLNRLLDIDGQVTNLESSLRVFKAQPKNISKAKDIRQKIGLTESQIAVNKFRLENQGSNPYTSLNPAEPTLFQRVANKFDPGGKLRATAFTAPEASVGDFGATGNRIFTPLLTSIHNADGLIRTHEGVLSHLSERARKALGFGEREWVRDTVDLHDAWVLGRETGLRKYARSRGRSPKDVEEIVDVMKEVKRGNFDVFQTRGSTVGLRGEMNLSEMGLVEWLPRVGENLTEVQMTKRLVAAGRTPDEIIGFLKKAKTHLDEHVPIEGVGGKGAPTHGTLDFDRIRKGGLREGLREGIPYNKNLFDASLRARAAAERRIALDPHVGRRGDQISTLTAAVKAEGGDSIRFETALNALTQKKYYDEAMRKSAAALTGMQVALKLPLAVIPNMTQAINTMVHSGMRKSLKGALAMTKREDTHLMTQMMGIHHQFIKGISRSFDDEGLIAGPIEKLADWVLRYTGFNRVERFNRLHAGMTSLAVINDTLAKGARQKLRGTLLDSRRKMFGDMGLDLDVLTRKIDQFGTEYLQSAEFKKIATLAAIRGSQKTQFFAGSTRAPTGWKHPIGRVLTQFKSFALGQSRFIRDGILIEAANGNLRPMVTMLSLAPIAGEAVGNLKAMIKQRDRETHGVIRALDNISYVGGLGLFTDILSSARFGDLEGVFLGPAGGDMISWAEAILSGEAQRILTDVGRTPAFTLGGYLLGAGAGTIEELDEYLDDQPGGGTEQTRTFVDIGTLRQQRIDRKLSQ